MTISEMKQKRSALIDEARAKYDAIESPTAEDEKALNALLDEADHLQRGIKIAQHESDLDRVDQRRSTPPGVYGEGRADSPEWRDERGNEIAVAGRGQSLAAEVRRINGGRVGGQTRIGEILRSIVTGQTGQGEDRAATGGLKTFAGYVGDESLSSQVIDLARSQARVAQAGAQFLQMPTSELSMAQVTSDPTTSWVGEAKTIPESESAYGRLKFRARKMATIVKISRELAEDAPNAVALMEQQLGIQFGLELDKVALSGDGGGEQPLGVLNTGGISTSPVSGSFNYDDFLDGFAAIEAVNGTPNGMLFSSTNSQTLNKLKDSTNRYLDPPPAFSNVGRFVTNQIENDTALIGDFTQLMIGVRSGIQFDRGHATGDFEKDLIAVRVTWRGDIQLARPSHFHAITDIS